MNRQVTDSLRDLGGCTVEYRCGKCRAVLVVGQGNLLPVMKKHAEECPVLRAQAEARRKRGRFVTNRKLRRR